MRLETRQFRPENMKICSIIFACQVVFVFSIVSMIYLTVAVYLPSYRVIHSDINTTSPAICETTKNEFSHYGDTCSCTNGCMKRKEQYRCHQIFVNVRAPGKSLSFHDCTNFHVDTCKIHTNTQNEVNRQQRKNMTGIYRADQQAYEVYNVTASLACSPVDKTTEMHNCTEYGCYGLNSVISCEKGICYKYFDSHKECRRQCENNIDVENKNIFLFNGDDLITAKCGKVLHTDSEDDVVWTGNHPNEMLMVNCMSIERGLQEFTAKDCVDGGVLLKTGLNGAKRSNYTYLKELNRNLQKVDTIKDSDTLAIAKDKMLFVNLDGCINTVSYNECDEFGVKYGNNGTDFNAISTFECFYSKKYEAAVKEFNLKKSRRELIYAVVVPVALFLGSLASLIVLSKNVQIGADNRMQWACCSPADHRDDEDDYSNDQDQTIQRSAFSDNN